jgi:hypothetical protein
MGTPTAAAAPRGGDAAVEAIRALMVVKRSTRTFDVNRDGSTLTFAPTCASASRLRGGLDPAPLGRGVPGR